MAAAGLLQEQELARVHVVNVAQLAVVHGDARVLPWGQHLQGGTPKAMREVGSGLEVTPALGRGALM